MLSKNIGTLTAFTMKLKNKERLINKKYEGTINESRNKSYKKPALSTHNNHSFSILHLRIDNPKEENINSNIDSTQKVTSEFVPIDDTISKELTSFNNTEEKNIDINIKSIQENVLKSSCELTPITNVISKTAILPLSKLTSSNYTEDERLNNIGNKLDEVLNHIEMIKNTKK
ncbi:10301_t:CDS:2 [Diversispora eburnea]|uniref:10301_t:CDS:1 n=1 Tax=Diversispora eburnea TaxID=1213867 RepID=A0A9N8V6U8_9GLOM|nr:10301_t:CDS:2 [Diversispora eburnea]